MRNTIFLIFLLLLFPRAYALQTNNNNGTFDFLGKWDYSSFNDIKIHENHCFVASDGLYVLDIADYNNPIEVSNLSFNSDIKKIVLDSNFCYTLGSYPIGLRIVNIENIAEPFEMGYIIIGQGYGYNFDALIFGDYLIVGSYNDGLHIVDISDPANPTLTSSIVTIGDIGHLEIKDSLLFTSGNWGLHIIDISNISEPQVVGHYDFPDNSFPMPSEGIEAVDNYIYLRNNHGHIYILDISNPAVPVAVNIFRLDSDINSYKFDNNRFLYASCSDSNITVIDCIEPINPKIIDYQKMPNGAWLSDINQNELFIRGSDGIYILSYNFLADINNEDETIIQNPRLIQNYPNPFNPSTLIKYTIPKDGPVSLKVYDVLGNEVIALVNETKAKGKYEVMLDASQLSSGIYFYQMICGNFSDTKKMILLK